MNEKIFSYVMAEAAKSNVEKRKVGCVILDENNVVVSTGFNKSFEGTSPDLHAEDMAIRHFKTVPKNPDSKFTIYVSHPPCPDCARKILDAGIDDVVVVEEFIKFDTDKLRMDLIPPSTTRALAEVLTFGAKKYKPNNWKNCKDISTFEAALLRHLQSYREGEKIDSDSGMPHLWHALTNIAFLIELDKN